MGVVTLHLDDDIEKLLRELARKKGKKKGAMSEVVEEALLNLAIEEEFDNLIRELKKGVRAEVGRLRREDIYEV